MCISSGIRLAAAIAALLVACGCAGKAGTGETNGTPVKDGTFRTAIGGDPGSLDPHMTVLSRTRWVTTFMYDSLVHIDDQGKALPYLAESWEADIDSVTYTLKQGITCSDGTPLTASDVAGNFAFVADPANKSPLLGLMVQPGLRASADDKARTVTLTSAQPDPFLVHGTGLMQIVCAKGLADRSILKKGSVGTGMFTLTEAVAGDHYSFQRREDYRWGPNGAAADDPGAPKAVRLQIVANESTAANMFLSGDLNAVHLIGPDTERVRRSGADSLKTTSLHGELFFNQQKHRPGSDPAVRTALAKAADFKAIGKVMTNGMGRPAQGLGVLEPKPCPADSVTPYLPTHDPAAAKAALDDAGWRTGADGVRAKDGTPLSLSLIYLSDAGTEMAAAAELLAQQWKEVGADIDLKPVTATQGNEIVFGTGDWDASLVPITVVFPSQLVPFMSGPAPPDGQNFASIGNDAYKTATTKAARLPLEQGCELWAQADRALVENADVLPFVENQTPLFVKGVKAQMAAGNPAPPTIRLYK